MDTAEIVAWEPRLRLAVFFAVLAALMVLELVRPLRRPTLSRIGRWSGNLGVSVVSTALVRVALPLLPVGAAVIAAERGWGLFHAIATPSAVAFLISFLALDLAIYGQHVAMHKVSLLWRLHRMHHSDLELDATTGLRFHPFEIVLSLVFKIALVLALGAPAAAVVVFEIVLNVTSMYTHANIRLPPALDRVLRLVLVTPLMHRVHHSLDRAETDSNYSFNFAWWDRLFRTYREAPAAGYERMNIGIAEFREPAESRLDRLLLQPFQGIESQG